MFCGPAASHSSSALTLHTNMWFVSERKCDICAAFHASPQPHVGRELKTAEGAPKGGLPQQNVENTPVKLLIMWSCCFMSLRLSDNVFRFAPFHTAEWPMSQDLFCKWAMMPFTRVGNIIHIKYNGETSNCKGLSVWGNWCQIADNYWPTFPCAGRWKVCFAT